MPAARPTADDFATGARDFFKRHKKAPTYEQYGTLVGTRRGSNCSPVASKRYRTVRYTSESRLVSD